MIKSLVCQETKVTKTSESIKMKLKEYLIPEINIISVESFAHILAGSDLRGDNETWEEGDELEYEEGELWPPFEGGEEV